MIVLRAKAVAFEVTYINLREKPDWFLAISPHGKVPVLAVDDQPLFESNAIAEYLDETVPPRLHPEDAIKRARNRAWTDFVPDFARAVSAVYYAETREALDKALHEVPKRLAPVERALAEERGNDGPYFNGPALSIVDAAYAPFLQRLDMIETRLGSGVLDKFPLVGAWSAALLADEVVTGSVAENFEAEFAANLARRGRWAAALFEANATSG